MPITDNVVDFLKFKRHKSVEAVVAYMRGLETQRHNNEWADFRYLLFMCLLYEKSVKETDDFMRKYFPDMAASQYHKWITLCEQEFEDVSSHNPPAPVDTG